MPAIIFRDAGCGSAAPVVTNGDEHYCIGSGLFIYQVTASQSPTLYEFSGLVDGITGNSETGQLNVEDPPPGTHVIGVTASNCCGSGDGTFTIHVGATPTMTSATHAFGEIGQAFSFQPTISTTASSWSATNLPDGLSINSSTGQITGTPTTAINEVTVVTLNFTDTNGCSGEGTLTIHICAKLIASGGNAGYDHVHNVATDLGLSVGDAAGAWYNFYVVKDQMKISFGASATGPWTLYEDTGCVNGEDYFTFTIHGAYMHLEIIGACEGGTTQWNFQIACG